MAQSWLVQVALAVLLACYTTSYAQNPTMVVSSIEPTWGSIAGGTRCEGRMNLLPSCVQAPFCTAHL